MSVAKRNKPNAPQQDQCNEDEGKIAEQDRFIRTNQALKWAKSGINEAKLFVYAKTGQIEESADDERVSIALQKLETYREQLSRLLHCAENWTKSLIQTWNYQTNLVDSLNECDGVIQTFNGKQLGNAAASDIGGAAERKADDESSSEHSVFARILRGIGNELFDDHQQSEKRYGHASNLLVVPLRNILNHEVAHALDLQRRYVLVKRQFDSCCTTISTLKAKIEELQHPDEQPEAAPEAAVGAFAKIKVGFGKLLQTTTPTLDDLEGRLSVARDQLKEIAKAFDHSKVQFLEALDIVEQKLNVEVVYYVQQFLDFMRRCKSGSISPLNQGDGGQREEAPQQQRARGVDSGQEADSGNPVVQAAGGRVAPQMEQQMERQEQRMEQQMERQMEQQMEPNVPSQPLDSFVENLQIDSMINNPAMANMDEVNLNSPDPMAVASNPTDIALEDDRSEHEDQATKESAE